VRDLYADVIILLRSLTRILAEPIHIPGSVQSFGALLAISVSDWEVRQVSENAIDIIGISAHELLQSTSLKDFLDSKEVEHLASYLLHLSPFPNEAGPEVFPIKFKPRDGDPVPPNTYFCAAHRFDKNPDLLILEIEIQDDERFPLTLQAEQSSESGESAENEQQRPSTKATNSTTPTADPVPRSFPTHLSLGEITVTQNFDSMMGVFNVIGKVNAFLGTKKTIRSLSKELSRIVQGITGFDRVLIYEFDQQWNGEVIAECIGLEGLESFMGLHFPSTDIPKQARELYLSNKVCIHSDTNMHHGS
jgi:light-regulated signal transduction histidine kinase (bacteriophytochrome)